MLRAAAVMPEASDGRLKGKDTNGCGGSAAPSRYCLPFAQVRRKARGRGGNSMASPQSVAERVALNVRTPSSCSLDVATSASPAIGISFQGMASRMTAIPACSTISADARCRASQYSIRLMCSSIFFHVFCFDDFHRICFFRFFFEAVE